MRDQKLFFDKLIAAAEHPEGAGFKWCNQTTCPVMAASHAAGTAYRQDPCLRPDVAGEPMRFYSYAEAVDTNGRTVQRDGTALAWGGKVMLCTRDGRFELSNQKDCAARGLDTSGFAVIEASSGSAVVTFK